MRMRYFAGVRLSADFCCRGVIETTVYSLSFSSRSSTWSSILAGFDRAFCFFTMPGKRRAQGVGLDRVFEADALPRHKTAGRIAFPRLPGEGILHSRPGIQSHHRPVAAEGKHATGILDAVPHPGALRALRAHVARPDSQRVFIRIGMQGLEAGNDSEFAETRYVLRADGLDVLDPGTHVMSVIRLRRALVGVKG